MSKFVDSLEFTNVKMDEKLSDSVYMIIHFTLNKNDFYLVSYREENEDWGNFSIKHSIKLGRCSLCKNALAGDCLHFNQTASIIAHQLLDHPNVRLKRLFL